MGEIIFIFIIIFLFFIFSFYFGYFEKDKIKILNTDEIYERYIVIKNIYDKLDKINKEIYNTKRKYENYPNNSEYKILKDLELTVLEEKKDKLKLSLSKEFNNKIKNLPLLFTIKNPDEIDDVLLRLLKGLAIEHFNTEKFIITSDFAVHYIDRGLKYYQEDYDLIITEKFNVIDLSKKVKKGKYYNLISV